MNVRARITVTGRVQGVFFRAHTEQKANDLGIAGWVRNTHEGLVEAVFEGEEKDVLEMIEFCREGPPESSVKDIHVEWEKFTGKYKGFEIRY